ncbi:hypothetical protein HZH68_008653 [Vespula germanica]|uniref:Uncharacterized protein n=1 Tax=Vespula germanica TaxID=30212 RepID=A0A834JZQ2_VESGE|nr:hypothetical protein HZH68_008653 [Vespula germanica]
MRLNERNGEKWLKDFHGRKVRFVALNSDHHRLEYPTPRKDHHHLFARCFIRLIISQGAHMDSPLQRQLVGEDDNNDMDMDEDMNEDEDEDEDEEEVVEDDEKEYEREGQGGR